MPTDKPPTPASAQSAALGGWQWFAVYSVLATVIQWPLISRLTTHISYGHEPWITVPLLNLWTVWWNADRAGHLFQGYWNAPIFYPTEKTFLFSEAQPTSLIVAPILWLTGNRGLAYNIYQLLIVALNGLSAHRLFRRLGHLPWLSFCGGFMSQILPFVMWQFGVVQLTTLFGIYWTLHAVIDLFERGSGNGDPMKNIDPVTDRLPDGPIRLTILSQFAVGLRLGFAYAITYWACNYWGLFLTVLLIPCSACFWNRKLLQGTFSTDIGVAAIVAGTLIGPFAWAQRSVSHQHNWQESRTHELVHDLSAHWRDHTDVPWKRLSAWLEFPERKREGIFALGGGGFKLLLGPVGLVAAILSGKRRRWGIFAATFGALAFGLSLGPTVRFALNVPIIGGICLYEQLQQWIPGLSLIRSPFRFALFVQLAAVWLTIEAIDLLSPVRWGPAGAVETLSSPWKFPTVLNPLFGLNRNVAMSLFAPVPLILVSVLVSLEAVPPTMPLYELPSRHGLPEWVVFLRDQAEPDSAITCLPFPTENGVNDYQQTALWMYWGTFHGKPLLNGYSGFFPQQYNTLREGLAVFDHSAPSDSNSIDIPQFKDYAPDNIGLKLLNESPARYVVVQRSFATRKDVWSHPATRFRWALVLSDDKSMVDVYKVPTNDE